MVIEQVVVRGKGEHFCNGVAGLTYASGGYGRTYVAADRASPKQKLSSRNFRRINPLKWRAGDLRLLFQFSRISAFARYGVRTGPVQVHNGPSFQRRRPEARTGSV